MARWYMIGHEQEPVADEGNGFFYNEGEYTLGASTTVTRDTAFKRTGLSSRAHTRGGSSAIVHSSLAWGLQGLRGYYARWYFAVSSLPTGSTRICYLSVGGSGSPYLGARLTATGKIQFFNEVAATQIGSDSAATVTTNTWYRLELYGITGAGAVDAGELRLDGVTVASTSGVSISDTQIQQFHYGWLTSPGGAFTIWADDVVVNDDQGTVNNSWPGESSILYSNPVGDNYRDPLWTAGAGGTSNLWEAENNNPPAGVASGSATDTSQIKNVTTTDTTQNYAANMETYATAGLDAGDTILNVQAVVQGGTSGASSVQGGLALVGNPFQATEDLKTFDAGAIGTYGVNWQSQLGTAQNLPVLNLAGTPIVRVGRRNTGASELHYCGMTVRIEFVPGTPGDYQIAWTRA